MGFQHMKRIVLEAASRKGGKVRTKKGLALVPEDKRKQVASMGGKAKFENRRRGDTNKSQASGSDSGQQLADILGDLDE